MSWGYRGLAGGTLSPGSDESKRKGLKRRKNGKSKRKMGRKKINIEGRKRL